MDLPPEIEKAIANDRRKKIKLGFAVVGLLIGLPIAYLFFAWGPLAYMIHPWGRSYDVMIEMDFQEANGKKFTLKTPLRCHEVRSQNSGGALFPGMYFLEEAESIGAKLPSGSGFVIVKNIHRYSNGGYSRLCLLNQKKEKNTWPSMAWKPSEFYWVDKIPPGHSTQYKESEVTKPNDKVWFIAARAGHVDGSDRLLSLAWFDPVRWSDLGKRHQYPLVIPNATIIVNGEQQ